MRWMVFMVKYYKGISSFVGPKGSTDEIGVQHRGCPVPHKVALLTGILSEPSSAGFHI
jgi:hypothetical protein